jgi:FtsH-binding integral membrane protein
MVEMPKDPTSHDGPIVRVIVRPSSTSLSCWFSVFSLILFGRSVHLQTNMLDHVGGYLSPVRSKTCLTFSLYAQVIISEFLGILRMVACLAPGQLAMITSIGRPLKQF